MDLNYLLTFHCLYIGLGLVCGYGLTFNSPPPVIVSVDYELCMAKFQITLLFSAYKYWLKIILKSEDKEEVI